MRFRLTKQDYIRLQTIAFFIPFIKLNKQSNPDNIYKIAYRCAQIDVCVIEADVFDSLSELYKSLNDLFKKNKIYDMPIRIGKQKTSGIELSKQIRVYKSLLSKEKQKKDEVIKKIDSKFYTISDAAQFIVKFSDIIDCYKFSELVKNVDFLQII